MSNTIRITVSGTLVALAMFGTPANASSNVTPVDFSNPAFAPAAGPTSIPVGAADFCKRDRADCAPHGNVVQVETLTPQSWDQLTAVNDDVNRRIVPETDLDLYHVEEYWTYPTANRGDCEDIALEKQRELIAKGWDPSALLMTVVREKSGDGHAVLMVRTDRGDVILDNQNSKVLIWNETPYEFVKRQSQADAGKWVGLEDNRTVVAATGR